MLSTLYNALLVVHIGAGLGCALALALALASRKGAGGHRVAGWVFVTALALTTLTGWGFAALWMGAPLAIKSAGPSASPEARAQLAAALRSFGPFFLGIGVLAAAAAWHGISATRGRRSPGQRWVLFGDWIAVGACAVTGVGLVGWGITHGSLLFGGFGALSTWAAYDDRRVILAVRRRPALWVVRHLQSMLGGATVVFTAFAVQAIPRLVGGGPFQAWVWLVPVGLGMGLSAAVTRKVRRRLDRRPRLGSLGASGGLAA